MTVSNTLSVVIPTLFAQGLMSLRSNSVMPRLVNSDFGTEVKQKGDTIQVPVPSIMSATDVVPGAYAPDPQNVAPTTAPIALSNWKEAPFTLTEKELAQVIDGVVPIQLSAAVESLATTVNSSILANYKGVYGYTGTAGATPFASDVTAITAARKILGLQLAPTGNRRMVVNPDAEANALGLAAFSQYLQSADPNVIREGDIGRKLGFDWYMDQQVPTQTAGTITTGLIAKASTVQAVGLTAIVCTTAASTGALALKKGDIIVFSGDTQTYAVTADATQASAATDVTVNISPGKVVALAGSETITVKASHVVNLAFHRDAFAFASRPLMNQDFTKAQDEEFVASDPVSKITMRLSYRKEFHRTRFAFDILWGTALIRPQLATRVAG
jgi:P22 coat protein - gene protein 5